MRRDDEARRRMVMGETVGDILARADHARSTAVQPGMASAIGYDITLLHHRMIGEAGEQPAASGSLQYRLSHVFRCTLAQIVW